MGWAGSPAAIRDTIGKRDPDIGIFTEYQPHGNGQLLTDLQTDGWIYHLVTEPPEKRDGIATLSKYPLAPRPLPSGLEPLRYSYLPVGIPDLDLEVRAMYEPLHREPYPEYWTAVLDALALDVAEPVLVVGGFNAGESLIVSTPPDGMASEFFCQIPSRGYTDPWRRGRVRSYNEPGGRGSVNGFRLDHAFGTAPVPGKASPAFVA